MTFKWPVPVYPLPDELLSSWLVRAALAHGCEPLSMTSSLWPDWRAWTMDIDRRLDGNRLASLSMSSGLTTDEIGGMTLVPHLEGVVFPNGQAPALLPWVIAMGSRNRQHKMGVQCCPSCLHASEPYFRWTWRLAWHTCCPLHQCELIANCPSCHTPIQFHRICAQAPHIGICFFCGFDLRSLDPPQASPHQLAFQEMATHIFERGSIDWGSNSMSSVGWFALTKMLLNLLRRSVARHTNSHSHMIDFVQSAGIDLASIQQPPTRFTIELLPADQRASLFAAVGHMLSLGSDELMALLKRSGVSRNTLIDRDSSCPEDLMAWLHPLPETPAKRKNLCPRAPSQRPKSKAVVRYEWARLLRRQGLLP